MTTTLDIAWLAGLLEGEGCFSVTSKSRTPRITLRTTDYNVCKRAAVLLDTPVYFQTKRTTGGKVVVSLQLVGDRAIGWMFTLYTLMGWRRRMVIRACLNWQ